MARRKSPSATTIGNALGAAINAARDWQATDWGQAAIAAGAETIEQGAVLTWFAVHKRETGNEIVLKGDTAIAREVGVSAHAGFTALTALCERHVIRPVRGVFGEDGWCVCGTHQGRVDALRWLDLPADCPRRPMASMTL